MIQQPITTRRVTRAHPSMLASATHIIVVISTARITILMSTTHNIMLTSTTHSVCEKYGEVLYVKIPSSRSCAFCQYKTKQDAIKAIDGLKKMNIGIYSHIFSRCLVHSVLRCLLFAVLLLCLSKLLCHTTFIVLLAHERPCFSLLSFVLPYIPCFDSPHSRP